MTVPTERPSADRPSANRVVQPSGWESAVHDRVLDGDDGALSEVYDQYASFVYGLALRVIGDPSAARGRQPGRVRRLLGTAHRVRSLAGQLADLAGHARPPARRRPRATRGVRRSRAERDGGLAVSVPDVEEMATALLTAERVRVALGELPVDQQRAIQLAYFGGKTYRQVAVELGDSRRNCEVEAAPRAAANRRRAGSRRR